MVLAAVAFGIRCAIAAVYVTFVFVVVVAAAAAAAAAATAADNNDNDIIICASPRNMCSSKSPFFKKPVRKDSLYMD